MTTSLVFYAVLGVAEYRRRIRLQPTPLHRTKRRANIAHRGPVLRNRPRVFVPRLVFQHSLCTQLRAQSQLRQLHKNALLQLGRGLRRPGLHDRQPGPVAPVDDRRRSTGFTYPVDLLFHESLYQSGVLHGHVPRVRRTPDPLRKGARPVCSARVAMRWCTPGHRRLPARRDHYVGVVEYLNHRCPLKALAERESAWATTLSTSPAGWSTSPDGKIWSSSMSMRH